MENHQLQFTSIEQSDLDKIKTILRDVKKYLIFKKENEHPIGKFNFQTKRTAVSLGKNIPEYFALYVQNDLEKEIDVPIPKYHLVSIRQLIENNRIDDAEIWLKQLEYNLYKIALQQYGQVDVTADFNTVRKELGLPLSSFVTGGESRKTVIKKLSIQTNERALLEEDIPFLESLGFTPKTADCFYARDIVRYFKEKTIGKLEATIRKYQNSLFDLRELLEESTKNSWEQCDESF